LDIQFKKNDKCCTKQIIISKQINNINDVQMRFKEKEGERKEQGAEEKGTGVERVEVWIDPTGLVFFLFLSVLSASFFKE